MSYELQFSGPSRRRARPSSVVHRASKILLPASRLALLVVSGSWCFSPAAAAEFPVASVDDFNAAVASAQPGDTITLRNGAWFDADLLFKANGTEAQPITLRAQTGGRVFLTGASRLRIVGSRLVVQGLTFTNGYHPSGDVIAFQESPALVATHCRVSDCVILNYNPPAVATDSRWVSLSGFSNRVDHCCFKGKSNLGSLLVVKLPSPDSTEADQPNRHLIDHNWFGPRFSPGQNGGETLRVGDSATSFSVSGTIVEHNYFEQCNGDIEIISSKSCDNVYRYNTFVDCEGALTFRHGNGCTAEGNYFFGHNRAATGGVRIMGEDHRVINNYFQDLGGSAGRSALTMMAGLENSPLNGYFQVKNALVAFNTFVNCSNSLVLGLTATFSQAGTNQETTLPPLNCTIANNVVYTTRNRLVDQRTAPIDLIWEGNIMFGTALGINPNSGILVTNPLLVLQPDGLWRPGPESPALAAAEGFYDFVTEDIKGAPRPLTKDVGCDQRFVAPPLRPPLTTNDVGPSWFHIPPYVAIGSPVPGAIFYQGKPLTVKAGAGDIDGVVTRVGFFVNGSLLGSVTGTPYETTFNPLAGDYVLTAVATDNTLLSSTSAPVTVTVLPPQPPSVVLTQPANGATPLVGHPIHLTAIASDLDGVVRRIEFFADGSFIGMDTSPLYEVTFTPVPGLHVLTAVAIDDDSLSRTSTPVAVTVRLPQPPSVAITAPTNAATFLPGWPVKLAAIASDPDRSVVEVQFLTNGTLLSTDRVAPFQANWVPGLGSYTLTAVAVDDDELATTSVVVNVTIAAPDIRSRPFLESSGLVVMEAEHCATNAMAGGCSWVATNSVAGFVGESVMQALPNAGVTVNANLQTASPALVYRVQFTNRGTYKLWIRGWAANGSDDSVHLGVDGQSSQALNYSTTGAWVWRASQITITNAGLHEINLWMREDGAYVDRLLLTTNLAFTPSAGGLAESPRVSGATNLPPRVAITSPADGALFLKGPAIPITTEANDADGTVARVEFFANGTSIGAATHAPYQVQFSAAPGAYVLTATATDAESTSTTSTVVVLTIGPRPTILPALASVVENGDLALRYEIPPELRYFSFMVEKSSNAVNWTPGNDLFPTDSRTQDPNGSERVTLRAPLNGLPANPMFFRLAVRP